MSDIDTIKEEQDAVTLITLHAAKGLEFPVVFIVGMDEGILPHSRSLEDENQMEEERRLAYVGITRAKQRLYLVYAFRRTLYGMTQMNGPSRFIADVPPELVTGRDPGTAFQPALFGGKAQHGPRKGPHRRGHPARQRQHLRQRQGSSPGPPLTLWSAPRLVPHRKAPRGEAPGAKRAPQYHHGADLRNRQQGNGAAANPPAASGFKPGEKVTAPEVWRRAGAGRQRQWTGRGSDRALQDGRHQAPACKHGPPGKDVVLLPPKKPRALKPGSRVAIVTPSWGGPAAVPHRYEMGLRELRERFGLEVVEMPHTRADADWIWRNPQARADDVNAAFADPSINGIITAIGGDDSIRILPYIDQKAIADQPQSLHRLFRHDHAAHYSLEQRRANLLWPFRDVRLR